ncbi:hypothetical protein A9G13_00570 [Gilliamella sp. wkB178]|uniref:hypothetical protein n=1 Tax=Gilliamella sp. wkB178 TaxID=3120259 RepID=UPI00080DE7E8|nr:hypothetical protein [Gilliamella apicola]OCG10266.1 hypothetical protein A9G13_00570 [Gilliamella apicola]
MSQFISIPRVNDSHLIKCLIEDLYKEGFFNKNGEVSITVEGRYFTLTKADFNEKGGCTLPIIIELKKLKSESINEIKLVKSNQFEIIYKRDTNSFVDHFGIESINGASYNREPLSDEAIMLSIRLHSNLLKNASPELKLDNVSNLLSSHHSLISQLEALNTDLIQKHHENVNQLINDKKAFISEQEKEFSSKKANLEDEITNLKNKLNQDYKEKLAALEKREQKIIDLDNTTARRKTTKDVLDSVKDKAEKFSFSPSVNKNYYNASALSVILLIFSGVFAFFSYISMLKTDLTAVNFTVEQWLIFARIFIFTLLTISSAIYLIRWFNAQGNRLANIELDYQKFSRDLSRADLTIEMCLEWNDKKEGQIPEELIKAMTKGLFDETDKRKNLDDIQHPAEQLASTLIKSAEKIEFPLGTSRITTKGKNLKS